MQQDLMCRKKYIHSSEGDEFYHHKSERSESGLLPVSRRHFRHQILTTPSSSFRRGVLFFFQSPSLRHFFVPSQHNGDVELLGYGSELQFSVEDVIMERRRATWAMTVEYRTSFGKGNVHQRMHVVEHYAFLMVYY
ncbi:hypothetical protein CDAR_574401 [Caerostris darwini]|uniref:Uncharacterized protein n=1 Tax=Caerostris darwini TaxID=1538125 RepID=A0AAV4UI60_9ARAC|nr:hypothetical protein CDAR_574401 [Caerostris darwini]